MGHDLEVLTINYNNNNNIIMISMHDAAVLNKGAIKTYGYSKINVIGW